MDEERNPVFPDVPTCKEQGYDITYYTQRGMAAPLGVDDAIMTNGEAWKRPAPLPSRTRTS